MTVFKCKMCGGAIEFNSGETVGVCSYCGTRQTLPRLDDDRRANLYDRANHFRRNNDYDKAAGIYEQILNEDPSDAEAYWSLVLCSYGIEYVEDPATHRRVPTVNRAQFTSVFDDDNYKSAMKNADMAQRAIYESEAAAINEIQKGILAISQKEDPFDVFICYKETDQNGRRTVDSVLAADLYHQLTQEGFKVFFSRITLEDKLGTAYEPYIFAALNSAKVMVVLGTKPEHFKAVWVKNEWSRYLALVKQSNGKKTLIPAYRDMDPYDLPDEFSHLQAQDMSKLGFMQDLIRGIKKIVSTGEEIKPVKETVVVSQSGANIAPLLRRAFMYLEDGEWQNADEYAERVLDQDPENADAYLVKLMAEQKVGKREALRGCALPFDNSGSFKKAVRFGDEKLKEELNGYCAHIRQRNETARLTGIYNSAVSAMDSACSEEKFKAASDIFRSIPGFKDSDDLAEKCLVRAEESRKDAIYETAKAKMKADTISDYESAIKAFRKIPGWRDADAQVAACKKGIEEKKAEIEADRAEQDRLTKERLEAAKKAAKKRKKIIAITTPLAVACIAFLIVLTTIIIPSSKYNSAMELYNANNYEAAAMLFGKIGWFSDARERSFSIWDTIAVRETVSAGTWHTVGLKADGTVVAVGNNESGQCNVSGWKDIIAVSAGIWHTVGLKADGTVVAVGANGSLQCGVSGWKEIIAVSAGGDYTVGLKADGTVVAVGYNKYGQCDVSGWRDIIAVSAGYDHTVGLKADGTVDAVGDNGSGQCNVSGWKDIIAVSAGRYHTVGLKADGTVVAVGDNGGGRCNVSGWKDIIAVGAGRHHTVGLKADGTVVAVGDNGSGQCDVSGWKDIIAVSAGGWHTVGLKADGTVVAVEDNDKGRCDVSDFGSIKLPSHKAPLA